MGEATMYLPPPGKIVIIGAGPVGLEAALYARYLGYDVEIFERGRVAENVRRAGEEKLATPFAQCASPLGLAALAAQDESFRPPAADAVLTCREWAQRYLVPLAQSDLVVDGLREQIQVVRIERLPPGNETPSADGEASDGDVEEEVPAPALRVHWQMATGEASHTDANVVIDCSGEGGSLAFTSGDSDLHVLGAKRSGADTTFDVCLGQIRDLFANIGGREQLNLYAMR
jgi:threonine dehydrogenase-like Zn-dependent dehydrogenase